MLLLGIVQQEAQLHPLARELAIGETAEAGQDGGEPAGLALGLQLLAGCTAGLPVLRHLREVVDQQVGRDAQVIAPPVAVPVRAPVQAEVAPGRSPLPAPVPCRSWPQSRNSIV